MVRQTCDLILRTERIRTMAKFEKGQSGNPGGRPKEVAEVRELARQHTIPAINTLAAIMEDEKAPETARIAAAKELLDRGYGRASQAVSLTDENDDAIPSFR